MKLTLTLLTALLLAPLAPLHAADPEQLFVRRIAPLFHEKCLACHGNDDAKIKGGLDMRTLVSTLKGGASEKPGFIAGKPDESPLYLAVTRQHDDWEPMPPKEADKLYAEQIAWIKDWIAGGAPWPDDSRVQAIAKANEAKWSAEDGITVKTTGALSPEWANRKYKPEGLWAYRPVRKPDLETIRQGDKETHSVDALISRKMPEGVKAAPDADARTFIRRATFDLTGLPPTPEEVERFVAEIGGQSDKETIRQGDNQKLPISLSPHPIVSLSSSQAEKAIASLIDRLLDSPHYGERQAQHWLDVTRYADTSGFSNDFERSGAWRYRDYVVRSFNADKPYDHFVREQIAGDLLDAKNPELVVAAGFLRMGPWEATVMNPAEVTRQQFLDDVVNHVGETFLAQALRCAKCHDHKFDPVPTHDYYRFMACFGDTHPAELEMPFAGSEVRPNGREEIERARRSLAALNAELDALGRKNFDAGMDWLKERGTDTSKVKFKGDGFFNTFNTFFDALPEDMRPPRNIGLVSEEIARIPILAKYKKYHQLTIQRFEPVAYAVYSGAPNGYLSEKLRNELPKPDTRAKNPPIHILTGGAIDAPADEVEPGVLSCLEALGGYPSKLSAETKSRVALADWIADARNPLTTRVIVNRVWQQHFGRGLVATPSNFGKMGGQPSNPELLDYLAAWFVDNGWSAKKLHRLIMSSAAYRRSARHPDPDAVRKADPNAQYFASFPVRRLSAEEIRDAMLTASGELNPAIGGVPVFPEINLEAALQPRYVMGGAIAPAYQPSARPEERHRRTLYSFRMRGLPDPLLEVFNRPNADFSCERRDSTTVTPQVFGLLNGQQPNDRALALAQRLDREAKTATDRIARAWQLVYGRSPREGEVQRALSFLEKMKAMQHAHPAERVAPPKSVRRSMVAEMTGSIIEWDELLDIFAGEFVPDAKPWDVNSETRALASLCLVLFNSNEFLYVE